MLKRIIILVLLTLIALVPMTASAIKYKGDLESNESLVFPEQAAKPTSPGATKYKLYFKNDGAAYSLDSSGNENPVVRGGYKNVLINGDFDLWQRGTSFTAAGYIADRWRQSHSFVAATYSRQAFTLGQTDVPGEPENYLNIDATTAAAATHNVLMQRIENVRTLAGQTVTLSLYAKADGAKTLTAYLNQAFGSGGSPSGEVGAWSAALSLTTSWQKFEWAITLPSISGKTIGTDANSYLQFHINETSGFSVFSMDIAQVQLEKGSVATDFEKRPIGLELALAQRYYQKTFPMATTPAQNAGIADALCYNALLAGVNKFNLNWYLKTPMRTDPTITYYNPSAANTNFRNTPDAGDSGAPATDVLSPNYVFIRNPQVAADGVGKQICIHAAADAEL